MKNKLNVLMIGPARSVKGGMTTVVNNYYDYGLDKKVNLRYLESCNDSNKLSKLIKEIKGFIEFKKIVKNYDILHIHMASRRSSFRKGKYVRLAKKYGKKVVIHIHGAEYKIFFNECNDKQKEYVKETLNLADQIIVLSEEWKEYFKNLVDESKIKVIYNAIVIPEDFEKDLDSQKLLFLGRIGQRKGIYDLVDVLEKLVMEFPNIKLYVGGDGEVDNLKKIIKEKKLEKNFEYIGWISGKEKDNILRECSIYILPSYNEGMPMSVLEGMAYKNVTISTNVGGIPKVIKNRENGYIIEPGDKDKLYNCLKEILSDSKLRKKLSDNGRKIMLEKFDINITIKTLIEVYNNAFKI